MNKYTFKQCLNTIDRIEIQGLSPSQLKQELYEKLQDKNQQLKFSHINELIDSLLRHNMISQFGHICDLSVPLTVFCRSPHNSISEALSFFEGMFQEEGRHQAFMSNLDQSYSSTALDHLFQDFPCFHDVIYETQLLQQKGRRYVIHPEIKPLLQAIEKERPNKPLVSTISMAYFIHDTTRLQNIPFRNQNTPIIRYPNYRQIMQAVPYRGIPEKRDASEGLQSFFKDCLFHEFEHQCEICGISIAQLLIASHIKPFRDCGHLIESTDPNNGVLLCKNHDFLFDQGYLGFDMNGKLMISSFLATDDYDKYHINPDFYLNKKLLTHSRQQFLEYHRKEYFKQ